MEVTEEKVKKSLDIPSLDRGHTERVRSNSDRFEDFFALLREMDLLPEALTVKPVGWSQRVRGDVHDLETRYRETTGVPIARQGLLEDLPDRLFVSSVGKNGKIQKNTGEVWEERRRNFLPFDSLYWKTWGKVYFRFYQLQGVLTPRLAMKWLFSVYGLTVGDHWSTSRLSVMARFLPLAVENTLSENLLIEILVALGFKSPKIQSNVRRFIHMREQDRNRLGERKHQIGVDWILGNRIQEKATCFDVKIEHDPDTFGISADRKVITDILNWFAPVWTVWRVQIEKPKQRLGEEKFFLGSFQV